MTLALIHDKSGETTPWPEVIKKFWLTEGINLEKGVSAREIELTESVVGMIFPDDMKELYAVVNGYENWAWNKQMFSVWPMERIRQEYTEARDKNFVGFCDYLINSHRLGFFKDRKGIYKDYDEFNAIAGSFREAIELMNIDSEKIY